MNTKVIKYIDLHKDLMNVRIDNLSSKKAILCVKLTKQKKYKIGSFYL